MKKVLIGILVLIMVFAMVGCDNSDDNSDNEEIDYSISASEAYEIAEQACINECIYEWSETDYIKGFTVGIKDVEEGARGYSVTINGSFYGVDKYGKMYTTERKFTFNATIDADTGAVKDTDLRAY